MDEQTVLRLAKQIVASTYENPSEWFTEWATGGSTDSGVAVNYNTALTYSSVFSAVNIISSAVAKMALNDTTLDADGNKTINVSSQVHWLLNRQPNELMTSFSFRRTVQSHALLQGNGYAAIQRNVGGMAIRLIPLLPENVTPCYNVDGQLIYSVSHVENPIPAADMLHIVGLSRDGICGISVVKNARNSFGLGLAEERHGSSHFKNGATPKVILKTPRNLTEDEAKGMLANWAANQEGSQNAGKTALAAGGLEIETVGVSNEDAQWLESRKFQRSEVATWFSLPEHKLNGEPGPYNSRIAAEQEFLRTTLSPHLCTWEQECERKMLPEREQRRGMRRLIHDTSDILSSDPEVKTKNQSELVKSEIISRNEARRALGFNRSDDPIADTLSSPATRTDNSAVSTDASEETVAAHRKLLTATLTRLINGESRSIVNSAKRTKDFVGWIQQFYDKRVEDMAAEIEPVLIAYSSLPGIECTVTSTELAVNHVNSSKQQILEAAGVSYPDNLATNVTEVTNQWIIRADETAAAVMGVTK